MIATGSVDLVYSSGVIWACDATCSSTTDHLFVRPDDNWSSTLPSAPASQGGEETEEERKAIIREVRRRESLAACALKSCQHESTPPTLKSWTRVARAPRPTVRKTATATKNFRRRW